MGNTDFSNPYLTFRSGTLLFALNIDNIQSIVKMPKITQLPETKGYERGIFRLRDKVYPLIDTRILFGFPPLRKEVEDFRTMLDERLQDHYNWLEALENAVFNGTEFTLTTDPHKCKFGKWYYSFKTDDILLRELLEEIEEPHNKIHAIAEKALSERDNGNTNAAKDIIDRSRETDLKRIINLFAVLNETFVKSKTETVINIEKETIRVSFSVDDVIAVEHIEEQNASELSDYATKLLEQEIVETIAKRSDDDSLIMVLLDEKLLQHVSVSMPLE